MKAKGNVIITHNDPFSFDMFVHVYHLTGKILKKEREHIFQYIYIYSDGPTLV